MRVLIFLVFLAASPISAPAFAQPALEDLEFLVGHWRGGDDFVFEETWSAPEGRVMTAMARGVSGGELQVLEYIVVAEEDGAVIMRFKHFNADYSTWEGDAEPLTLALTKVGDAEALFTADPSTHTVTSIRYWMPDENTLQADLTQIENDEKGSFSLVLKRVD